MKKVRLSQRQLGRMRSQGIIDPIAPGVPRTGAPEGPGLDQLPISLAGPVRVTIRRDSDGRISELDIMPLTPSQE